MKKTIIICVALLAFTSINASAAGSKRPPKWPPVPHVAAEIIAENHNL